MILIQFTGLSGSGKSTIAFAASKYMQSKGYKTEVIDGDEYRQHICKGLGYTREDRNENIRRLGFVSNLLARNGIISIIAAINPYESVRTELKKKYENVKTIWINCAFDKLVKRDTKGLYKKVMLTGDTGGIHLSGVDDPYEEPPNPDLIIDTTWESESESVNKFIEYLEKTLSSPTGLNHRMPDQLLK